MTLKEVFRLRFGSVSRSIYKENDIMAMKSKKQEATEQDKPQTRYDKKMEARRKQAAKDKRAAILLKTLGIIILAGAIGTCGYFATNHFIKINKATHDPYVKIGDHELNQVEYDYYYNATINSYISSYGSFLSYMGLDTTLPYEDQEYSEDMTWKDYFEQMTISQLSQEFALYDDALSKNYEYNTADEYNDFVTNSKESADADKITLSAYIKDTFGEYATLNRIKPYVERTFYTSSYYDKLLADNAPTDEEVDAYYQEHNTEYDQVTYYSFAFNESNYTDGDDDSDSAAEAAHEAAEADAEDMLKRIIAGEDFEALCKEYAPEAAKDSYNTGDGEYSLTSGVTSTSVNSSLVNWLYDDSRKAGDTTMINDESVKVFYVLKFVSKEYDDTCTETISSTLSDDATTNYINELMENYDAEDIKGEIGYLSTTESAEDENNTESLLNTDIIE